MRRSYVVYGNALMAVLLAVAARWALDPTFGPMWAFTTFYFSTIFAAWLGGFGPGLFAGVLGFFFGAYLFDDSAHSMRMENEFAQLDAIRYALVSILVSGVCEALHRSRRRDHDRETRLRAIVEHAVDAIITIDAGGVIESINPSVERLFGYRAEEIVGQNVKMLMPEPYRAEHNTYIDNYLRTGQAKIIGIGREATGRRKDGSTFPIHLSVSEFTLGERHYFTGVVHDMTEEVDARERLRASEEQLRKEHRRKDEFLATLAHELRNPLAPIRNALELIKRAQGSRDVVERSMALMERQVGHMVRLVDDLMDVGRIAANKITLQNELLEIAKVVDAALEAIRPQCDRLEHDLSVVLPETPIYVRGDRARLVQVISNLLNNACKYTERKGRIEVAVRAENDAALISVKDSGVGIAPEMLSRIFELFAQVDSSLEREHSGLGIGLSLARRLIELHGGAIEARSEGLGKGSEFIVRLPALPDIAIPQSERMRGHAQRVERRVLVVDDNSDAAQSLAQLLQIVGSETKIAFDGAEALSAAEQFRPDVALLDIGMPKLNGYEVCRHLRQQPWGKDILIVALTGWGQEPDRRQSEDAGFDRHLVKPVEPQALLDLIAAQRSSRVATPA